ncbi:MAG: LacI family DNA-binding transcriptional regulator [Pleomorphochaeta sp.]
MATIKDIAKKSGLAVGTVSRILNNRGYISEASKQKVEKAMKELNYQPNIMAQNLSKTSSNLIGVIVPNIEHPYFSTIVAEIEKQFRLKGFQTIVMISYEDETNEEELIIQCLKNRVFAIILCSGNVSSKTFETNNIPVISIERHHTNGIASIVCDNYLGGKLATEHLIDQGCKNLLCLSGQGKINMPADDRVNGFKDVAKKNNVKFSVEIAEYSIFQNMDYNDLIKTLYEKHKDIDGVFCTSDVQAIQFVSYLSRAKVLVPKDIKVIGYDDTFVCNWGNPKISSIRQPLDKMVEATVNSLIDYKNGEIVKETQVFPVSLIKRESTN